MRVFIQQAIFLFSTVLLLIPSISRAEPVSCQVFMTEFIKHTSDMKMNFVRPLVVFKGGFTTDEILDLVPNVGIDGTLRCRGERIVKFEAKVSVPVSKEIQTAFDRVQQAALASALGWSKPRIDKALRQMTGEAKEYLRASQERGDIVFTGKTEYHEGGGDLGMIWTRTDRTLIIAAD